MIEKLSNIYESETLETSEGEMILRLEGPLAIGYQGIARLGGNEVPYEVVGPDAVKIREGVVLGDLGDDIYFSAGVAENALYEKDIPRVVGETFIAEPGNSAIMIVTATRNLYVHLRSERKVGDIVGSDDDINS
jgi:hypothetical protein